MQCSFFHSVGCCDDNNIYYEVGGPVLLLLARIGFGDTTFIAMLVSIRVPFPLFSTFEVQVTIFVTSESCFRAQKAGSFDGAK